MCEFAYLFNCAWAKIIFKCPFDFISSIDKFFDCFFVGDTKTTRRTSKSVKLITSRTCIQALEILVHFAHLCRRLSSVFAYIRHRLFHVSVIIDTLANFSSSTTESIEACLKGVVPLIEKVSQIAEPLAERLRLLNDTAHGTLVLSKDRIELCNLLDFIIILLGADSHLLDIACKFTNALLDNRDSTLYLCAVNKNLDCAIISFSHKNNINGYKNRL